MKKLNKKSLKLSTETVRDLSENALRRIAGGLEPTSARGCQTITCNEDCDSYACSAGCC